MYTACCSVNGQRETANRVGNDAKDYHSKDLSTVIGPVKFILFKGHEGPEGE
jgi:hypothetical protein